MALNRGQSWLTYVTSDDLVTNAMVLAESLRRVRTSRRICVITSANVSGENRVTLRKAFDHVFYMDACIYGRRSTNGLGKDINLQAKIFAFSLRIFEKCVILGPNSTVLENLDKLFEGNDTHFKDLSNGQLDNVFLFTPNMDLCEYLEMLKWNDRKIEETFANRVEAWIKNNKWKLETEKTLELKITPSVSVMKLSLKSGRLLGTNGDCWGQPAIVQFVEEDAEDKKLVEKLKSFMQQAENLGLSEKVIFETWITLHEKVMYMNNPKLGRYYPAVDYEKQLYENEPIAIIGMSCRFPGANNLEEFWDVLYGEEETINFPPEFRWKKEQIIYNCGVKERQTQAGFLSQPVDMFDSKFFGVSPKDSVLLDPQARLLHEVLWEGLENSGIDPHSLHGSHTGIFTGSWMNDYKDIIQESTERDFFRTYMGNSIGATAARLSFLLGLTGPSIATESGCSSAIVALDLAVKSLRSGESHLALAGGVNLLLHPFKSDIIDYVIAPDGRCKTFDEKADGFGRAEGCGVLVLKRLSDALRDKDNIWAMIRGSAVSQEGLSRSLGTPTVHCEALAMELALKDANITPDKVSFVETHGTGTSVGDPMEVAAIAKAYHSKARKEPLIIGSVKTNVGHTESCSGITGIIKTVLAMQHELIPKHLNLETLNPHVNLDAIPAKVPLEPMPWPKVKGQPRLAGVSSFGITGSDGHVILEEAPDYSFPQFNVGLERPLHVLKISAKTQESLNEFTKLYSESLKTSMENAKNETFANVAYTANTGRASFTHRAFLLASDYEEAINVLDSNQMVLGEAGESGRKICFLFTGQGSQYPGMAKSLYEHSPVFRFHFDQCDSILKDKYKLSIRPALWGNEEETKELKRTLFSQTSIFVVEYCMLKLWESWGVKPDFVLGHSLGEFCAAVAAGVLTFEDALMLVAERSRLIDNLPRGSMLVIKASQPQVDQLMKQNKINLDLAAVNSSEQTVVAGDTDTVFQFLDVCKGSGLKAIVLESTHAFHSRHMDPMLEEYRKIAQTIKHSESVSCQYISGMEGKLLDGPSTQIDANYWVRHTRQKVSFLDACKAVKELECVDFLELGPQPVLSTFVLQNIEGLPVSFYPSLRRNTNEWETLLTSLGKLYLQGYKIDWEGYDKPYIRKTVPTLPFHPFNRKSFWVECCQKEANKIHPLLGSTIANASTQNIFQNDVNIKSAPYLTDHCIGTMTVFPGAGFTEMCLSAGYCVANVLTETVDKPRRPIALENVRIEAPLELQEGKCRRLQTIVKLREDGGADAKSGYECRVYHQNQNEDGENGSSRNWVPHASATFYPFASVSNLMNEWKPDAISEMVKQEPSPMDGFYKTVDGVGLKFGEQFRTLKRHWFRPQENGLMDEIVAELNIPPDNDKYLLHPLVIDAMIQSSLLSGWRNLSESLRVPVGLGKLVLLNNIEQQVDKEDGTLYVHAKWEDGAKCRVFVATSSLVPIAVLENVEVIETTVKTIQSVLAQQISKIPDSWEEVWKPIPGPLENRVELHSLKPVFAMEDFQQRINAMDKANSTPEDAEQLKKMNRLVCLYALRALFQLGWKPEKRDRITLKEFCEKYKILPSFCQLLHFYFCMFQEEEQIGMDVKLINEQNGHWIWEVINVTSSCKNQLESETTSLFKELCQVARISTVVKIYQHLGGVLAEILTGEKSILPILFPEDSQEGQQEVSAEMYYQQHPGRVEGSQKGVEVLNTIWRHLHGLNEPDGSNQKRIYRVLEVGAGVGSMSMTTVALLAEIFGAQFEYYFTDVSAVFFRNAEKKLSEFPGTFKFLTFDIEQPPLDQGIPVNYFDMVLASDVLHIAKNLKDCLWNLRHAMKPGGHLFFTDTFTEDRGITFVFGLLDGYWRFQDFDVRPNHTCVNGQTWKKLILESGFDFAYVTEVYLGVMGSVTAEASNIPGYNIAADHKALISSGGGSKKWVIFSPGANVELKKVASVIRASGCCVRMVLPPPEMDEQTEEEISAGVNSALIAAGQDLQGIVYAWAIDTKVVDQRRIAMPFMHIAKHVLEMKKPPKIYVLTRDVHSILETHMDFNPSGATLFGATKSLKNEYAEIFARYVDLDVEGEMGEMVDQILFELAMNKETKERERVQVAYREGLRYEPRFNKAGLPKNPARDDLQLPPSSERYQLVLPESRTINDLSFDVLEEQPMNEDYVEVATKAYALNFRDIFSILKPTKEFENEKAVGLDFAGVVTKVGARVTSDKLKVGDRVFGIKMEQIPLPSHVVKSADYLVKIPEKMTFEEAATLPAVFCTSYHCLITIAKMKKGDTVLIHTGSGGVGLSAIQLAKYIGANIITTAGSPRKRAYLRSLGIEHVFHSRNTSYEQDIMRVTNGRGVDVVLNSLTGPGFKEATLNACAKNARFVEMSKLSVWTEEEVKDRRPDVEYSIVDLTQLEKSLWVELLEAMKTYLENDFVTPIPYVQFDALRIRQALQYFQKAKHIGKVVVKMPEIKTVNGQWQVDVPLFNAESTYVITGGLGGIGFEVCKWMLTKGATDIVLIGRNPPKPHVSREIDRLNSSSKEHNVIVKLADVGDPVQCKSVFEEISATCPKPIRGIHHCAGVLRDNLYANQTWETFMSAYNPKINGAWNLDRLTRHLPLEHFILYSSITALMGTPSQANHSSANCFKDAFAHYRYSLGLPATTINWGQWSQVGCAKEVNVTGVLPVSVKRMLNGLEEVLRSQRLQVAFGDFESLSAWNMVCPSFKYYLDERLQRNMKEGQGQTAQVLLKTDQFWLEMDQASGKEEKMEVVMVYMKAILRAALRMDADEPINNDANMSELGVDSLMLIELKNTIQSLLGSRLNVSANMLKDCQTIRQLSTCIVNRLYSGQDQPSLDIPLSPEELLELLKNDCILDESIQPPSAAPKNVREIKRILVSGATGFLGCHVLSWLCKHASWLEKIVCLVRAKEGQCPRKKLKNNLEAMKLLGNVDLSKIECIRGDLIQPNLGLDAKVYTDLSSSVEAVVHLAAKSNHVELYKKSENGLETVREVNVEGTQNILKFATTSTTKHVYYASSILCVFGGGEDPTALSDSWPQPEEIKIAVENRVMGYPLSKYVSEMLIKQAVERGVPCKAFRFPWIMGDSQTGQLNYIQNHYVLRFLSYLKIKALPAAPLPAIVLPVDMCADLSMKVFWNEQAPNEVFNIAHPSPQLEVEFVQVAKEHFGVEMEMVDWDTQEFMEKLYAKGSPLEGFKEMYADLDRTITVTVSGEFQAIQGYLTYSESFFQNSKLKSIVPDFAKNIPSTMDIIRMNLEYVRKTGFLEKFGLKI